MASKIALVTGAARGIGKATAARLAWDGCDIVLADVCAPSGAETAVQAVEAAGRSALFVQTDVGDRAAVEALFARAQERFGRLDVLVNNAAINIRKPLIDLAVEDVARVWAVAQWGVFHCAQLAARRMVEQGEGGAIVSISSVHAVRAFPSSTAYNGAKAAVNQMTRTWAAELAKYRIRVNAIEPGWIDTPGERAFYTEEQILEEGARLPLGRLGRPEEIADAVSYLASDRASYVTGTILRVDGGILLPS